MIPRPQTHSQTRRAAVGATMIVGIAIALAVTAGLATAAGPADGSERTAAVDGQSAVAVTLEEAPAGVQRYNLTVDLAGPDGARIESARAGDVEGFEVRSQTDDSITFRAADLAQNVQAGAADVTLGAVTVAGTDGDDPDVTVTTHDFRNDESEQIEPSLTVEPASVGDGSPLAGEGPGASDGGGSGSGLADALPGTPVVWALGAAGLTVLLAVVAAWRW